MRLSLLLTLVLLTACGESIPPPDYDKTEPVTVEVIDVPPAPVVEEVMEEPDPIAVEKDEIEENTYQVVDASKLTGLQSIKYDVFLNYNINHSL